MTGAAQNLTLTYDDANNVKAVADATTAETVTYGYDELNRLKTAAGFASGLGASYDYDPIGNLKRKTEGATDLTLQYPAPGPTAQQPHAVSKITGTQTRPFTLDKNGNQIGSGNDAYDFNAENRLVAIHGAKPASPFVGSACVDFDSDGVISILDTTVMTNAFGTHRGDPGFDFRADLDWDDSVTIFDLSRETNLFGQPCPGQQTRYVYDAGGTLAKRTNADGSSTVYVGGIFEKTFTSAGVATGTTKYYSALGRTIAMRQTPLPAGGAGAVTYLLADHLGTTVGAIDAATGAVSTQKYWPYGATRSGAITQTDKLYTGQQQEAGDALGLYNYKARFYSTVTGRFVSADPVVPPANSVGLNRYAYVRNNPLRYIDPSGYDPTQQDINNCAANLSGCFAWSYGISPNAMVIVMGWGQGIDGGLFGGPEDFWGYTREFLARYHPRLCWQPRVRMPGCGHDVAAGRGGRRGV